MILLPFTFKRLDNNKVFIVNIVGEFLIINKLHFEMLVNEDFKFIPEDIKMQLLARHFICGKEDLEFTEDLLAIKLRTKKDYLSDFTSLHMVVLTLRCNCMCSYCHASSKGLDEDNKRYDMSIETAQKTVDMIFESPSNYIKIEFQGGEPLLNWPVLKYIVMYAEGKNKQKNKNLSFVICTNLLSIDEEKLLFIKKHNIDISTSCDGPQYYHDKNRKSLISASAYETFINNLHLCKKFLGENAVSALLTVTKGNLYNLREVVDEYRNLGFKNVFIRALNPYGYAVDNKESLFYDVKDFIEEYKKALRYIIELNLKGIYFEESYATLLLQRILTPFSTGFVDLQSPCGAGISGVVYYYNGDVYPADEARMLATRGNKKFLMGNVKQDSFYDIFYGKVIKELVYKSCVESLPGCANCAFNIYCGADPIRYYVESESIVGKRYNSGFCEKNKAMIDEMIRYLSENEMQVMRVFWSWINKTPLGESNV